MRILNFSYIVNDYKILLFFMDLMLPYHNFVLKNQIILVEKEL